MRKPFEIETSESMKSGRDAMKKTKEVLMRESNVVHVSAPVTVVGDIHG